MLFSTCIDSIFSIFTKWIDWHFYMKTLRDLNLEQLKIIIFSFLVKYIYFKPQKHKSGKFCMEYFHLSVSKWKPISLFGKQIISKHRFKVKRENFVIKTLRVCCFTRSEPSTICLSWIVFNWKYHDFEILLGVDVDWTVSMRFGLNVVVQKFCSDFLFLWLLSSYLNISNNSKKLWNILLCYWVKVYYLPYFIWASRLTSFQFHKFEGWEGKSIEF